MSRSFPRKFGPYLPLRLLGKGGMGVVYCAQDGRDPSRVVALKVVSQAGSTPELERRFVREAKILERLRHPNIVSFYEVGSQEGEFYFAMELLTGSTLSAWIGRPYTETVPLLVQICEGMEYLATRGVVHRDLSPDNVFVVQESGRFVPKILDFGIAKDTTAEETLHNFTRTGLLMGKPQYWSPEQIGNLEPGQKIDWRSDVYTLGIIFYRVLSARFPFDADSPYSYISLHLKESPPELRAPEGLPELPPPLVALVEKMMAKDREARPQNYREIVRVLRTSVGEELPPAITADHERLVAVEVTAATGPVTRPTSPTREEPTRATVEELPGDHAGREATEVFPGAPTFGTGTEATKALPRPVPEGAAPAPRRPALAWAVAAAVAAAAVVGTFLALRPGPAPPPVRPTPSVAFPSPVPPAVVPAGRGVLALDAMPWGRVVSVTDEATGRAVPLGSDLTTPVLLELPPGRYGVELASGAGPERQRLDVELIAGRTESRSVAFVSPERVLPLLTE